MARYEAIVAPDTAVSRMGGCKVSPISKLLRPCDGMFCCPRTRRATMYWRTNPRIFSHETCRCKVG